MVTPRRSHPVAPLYHRPDSGYTNAEIDALIAGVGGGGPHDLDSHTDVDTTGVASGDVLTYDGADWVPQAPAAGVSSFIARTGAVVAVAGDYDAFYYTEAEVDALIASFVDGSGTATDRKSVV